MDDDKFYLNCEEFNPRVMNYGVVIMKTYDSTYHVVPDPRYGWSEPGCTTAVSIGSNPDDWKDELVKHLQKIDSLGFNAIRVVGLDIKYEDDILQKAEHWVQEGINDPECYYYSDNLELILPDQQELFGGFYQDIVDVIKENNLPLKLILLPGRYFQENENDIYSSYLAYLANKFKDEPVVMAYDLYNEPNYNYVANAGGDLLDKYETAQIVNRWCDSIQRYAPSQLITYGPHIFDVFDWDPEILNVDFVSLHSYPKPNEINNWEYGNGYNRFLSTLRYYRDVVSKPWIIGETGLPGTDMTFDTLHPIVKSEAIQAEFAHNSLRYSNYYGALGYSWWIYKDIYTSDTVKYWKDVTAYSYFLGIVKLLDSIQAHKSAGDEFSETAYNWEDGCDTCSDLSNENYYNPYQLETSPVLGTVTDSNTIPIEGALIKYNTGPTKYRERWTYSDSLGNFKAYLGSADSTTTISMVRCSAPGMTFFDESKDSTAKSGPYDIQLDFLKQDSIPDKTIWYPTIIDSGQIVTWEQPMVVAGKEVIVKPYGKLIIKSKVYLGCNQKIIVERGGELEIDGGHLNAMNGMWKGIEVWGTKSLPATTTGAHGVVRIKNGSIIENAIVGIRTAKFDSQITGYYNQNYSGGKISVASGSVFKNCYIGVYFYPYPYNNISSFTSATFETTDSILNATGYPAAGIYMNGVSGIDINGCTFINSRDSSAVSYANRGKGINSIESTFIVREYDVPHGPDEYGSFGKLHYGIYSTYTTSNNYMTVEKSSFIKNWRGIYASAMDAGQITEDTFLIDQPFEEDGGCGLYLDDCTGYWVEGNHFYGDSDTTGIGIVVNNSGEQSNEIYRNTLDNLDIGISAQEQNKDPRSMVAGLEILCNKFEDCLSDIIIPYTASNYGIALHQGRYVDDPEEMAGNLFHIESQTADGDYDDLENQGDYFYYYYPSNPDQYYESVQPIDITEATIGDISKGLTDDWIYDDGCPSQLTSGGGTKSSGSGDEMKDLLVYYTGQVVSLEETLMELIDGGNSEALNTAVEFSAPPEALEIYNELMMESPFLSETVVETSIEKETVLPNAMVRDVMVANPHSAVTQDLIEKLDERNMPMPDYMKAQILNARNTITLKTELESILSGHRLRQARAFNGLVRKYLSDSINQLAAYDSLVGLCQLVNSKNSKYRLAFMHFHMGEYEQGTTVLNDIPVLYNLCAEELAEHNNIVDYFTLLQAINQDGRTELESSEQEIQQLLNFEQASTGIAGAYARNILFELNQIEYLAPIQIPDIYKSSKEMQEYSDLLNSKVPSRLAIFPNPAHDYVIIEYHLEMGNDGIIEIKDVNGLLVKRESIQYLQDQVTVNTKGWDPGLYIATLKVNGKPVESCKFTHVN